MLYCDDLVSQFQLGGGWLFSSLCTETQPGECSTAVAMCRAHRELRELQKALSVNVLLAKPLRIAAVRLL